MTVQLIQPQLTSRPTDKTELLRVLGRRTRPDLSMTGIAKLADLTVSDRIDFDLMVEPETGAGKVIYWQSPGPRAATSALAEALRPVAKRLEGLSEFFIEEHSQHGWGVGTLYDLLNRSNIPLGDITHQFEGSTIVLAGATTRTPFLIRSITPSARLLVIDTHAPRAVENRDFDRFIRVDAQNSDITLRDVSAEIQALSVQAGQILGARAIPLKGRVPFGTKVSLDQTADLIFIIDSPAAVVESQTPAAQIEALYEQAICVLVPHSCKDRYAREFHGDMLDHITMLMRLLGLGARLKLVAA